jgi:hypothetical protein
MVMSEKEKRVQEALGLRKTPEQLQAVINDFRRKTEEEKAAWQRVQHKEDQEMYHKGYERKVLIEHLCKASVKDYLKWLEGFFNNGGLPSHCYDYPFERRDFYIAHCSLKVPALYGAMSLNIIVPVGVSIQPIDNAQGFGHIGIFWMDGFKINSNVGFKTNSNVAIYNDTNFK